MKFKIEILEILQNIFKFSVSMTLYISMSLCSVETLGRNAWDWVSKFYLALCCCSI